MCLIKQHSNHFNRHYPFRMRLYKRNVLYFICTNVIQNKYDKQHLTIAGEFKTLSTI